MFRKKNSNKIVEKGALQLKIVAYTVTILFVIASLLPMAWMLITSMKDNTAIDAYPPTFLPEVPASIEITLDYTNQPDHDPAFYEQDAMEATWYPWMKNMRENIGEVKIVGVKDGKKLYEAKTRSAEFMFGQPLIVPSTNFKPNQMERKMSIIHDNKLSKFVWYEQANSLKVSNEIADKQLSSKLKSFFEDTELIDGQVVSMEQSKNWLRMFDSYLMLNKLSQDTAGKSGFYGYFINSMFVTVASIASQLILGGMAGYALSHLVRSNRLKFWLVMFFLGTIMIPDVAILLPLYMTMEKLNLINSLWAVILPHTAWGIVIFLFKGFFDQLPKELMQAARIDGASEIRTFTQMVLPMSIPIFTIVGLMTFIPVWNEFMWPLIVLKNPESWTFTVALNDLQTRSNVRQNVIMASAAISMIPLLILFSTCQKYIEKGISFTGVKG
ncbi:carbohydrate ABC transporter permease [Paenibacillus yanchengensis]|uniref:Carbohydrate ABC transporter permease n=1 Tax=Paenibacillus yanchengensis TaxID=2035833 RepID=A0ABW4YIC3_9BACL